MRRLRFSIPLSIVLFLALTLAGTYYVRKGLLERHLFSAMETNDEGSVLALLHSWPYPGNVAWKSGWTPLHWAAEVGNVEIARRLLDKGADVAPTGRQVFEEGGLRYVMSGPMMPLHVAARHGRPEVIRLLIRRGADVEAVPRLTSADVSSTIGWGPTPLLFACGSRNAEAVRVLLEFGARIEGPDGSGLPLVAAAGTGDAGVVRVLLERGARISRGQDRDRPKGAFLLSVAEQMRAPDVAEVLRQYGARDATAKSE